MVLIPNNKEKSGLVFGDHPTQKPLQILRCMMITASTNPGDIVLAPFGGVGSECVAAKELGRKYIGAEINTEYYQIAVQRLKDTEGKVTGFCASSLYIQA